MSVSSIMLDGLIDPKYLPGGDGSGFVPYVGATQDVNLNGYNLTCDELIATNDVTCNAVNASGNINTSGNVVADGNINTLADVNCVSVSCQNIYSTDQILNIAPTPPETVLDIAVTGNVVCSGNMTVSSNLRCGIIVSTEPTLDIQPNPPLTSVELTMNSDFICFTQFLQVPGAPSSTQWFQLNTNYANQLCILTGINVSRAFVNEPTNPNAQQFVFGTADVTAEPGIVFSCYRSPPTGLGCPFSSGPVVSIAWSQNVTTNIYTLSFIYTMTT